MRKIIVFDLETNGIRNCSVLSISAIKLEVDVENLKIEGKYGKYKWPKLNETAEYYGIEVDELSTHRSDYDTYLCKEIFVRMFQDNNYNNRVLDFLNAE